MFDLLDRPLHWILVKWPGLIPPKEDENAVSTPGFFEIDLRVDLLDREEAIWRFPALFGLDDEDPDADRSGNAWKSLLAYREEHGPTPDLFESFKHIVHDWRGVNASGRRVKIDDDNIRKLLAAPMFEGAFKQAYILALGGMVEEREKNSEGSPKGGPEEDADGRQPTKGSSRSAKGSASTRPHSD